MRAVADSFALDSATLDVVPHGAGLINQTFVVKTLKGKRYLLQRINRQVFSEPARLMANYCRVTEHLRQKAQLDGRVSLKLIAGKSGASFVLDEAGEAWRMLKFIPNSVSYRRANTLPLAEKAAEAFGRCALELADLPEPALHPVIPNFHYTPGYFNALQQAADADSQHRVDHAKSELKTLFANEKLADLLEQARAKGTLKTINAHNDTKIDNVLFDQTTGEVLCVVDFDTVMPGLLLHDFGDMVRSAAASGLEDAQAVDFQLPLFEALMRGYVNGACEMVTPTDIELMPLAPQVIALELAMRFLLDYLNGDVYFRAERPTHNLDRARAQLGLLKSMQAQQSAMESISQKFKPAIRT